MGWGLWREGNLLALWEYGMGMAEGGRNRDWEGIESQSNKGAGLAMVGVVLTIV